MGYSTPWPEKIALTIPEAIVASGLGDRTLRRAIAEEKLPTAFVCGRRRISPRALERFMSGLPPEPADVPQMRTISVPARAVAAE